MKKISIVVLNYNNEKNTLECLDSLSKLNYPRFQVIVVENGSETESVRCLRKHINSMKKKILIKLVRLENNVGFTGGSNKGVEIADTDLVALLNNDTTFDRNYLLEMVKVIESGDNIALVGSRIFWNHHHYDEMTLGAVSTLTALPVLCYSGRFTFLVSGCSMLLNKKITGLPFDEDYFMYGEDLYVSWLSNFRGYRCVIAPDSKVFHKAHADSNSRFDVGSFHGSKNAIMNVLIFFEAFNRIKIFPLLALQVVFSLIVQAFRGKLVLRLKSYWWVLKNFRKILYTRRRIQSLRVVSDRDLAFGFTCRIPRSYGIFGEFVNFLFWLYCFIVRLHVREVYRVD